MSGRPLTEFELRLLSELKEVVAERAEACPPRRSRPWRRAALVLAAVAVGLPLFHGGTATPAYAVDASADGVVTVTIQRLEDAEGLERGLRAHGVRAKVVYTPARTYCGEPWITTVDTIPPVTIETTDTATTFRLRPSDLAADQTLVVQSAVATSPDSASSAPVVLVGVALGPVPSCRLTEAPPMPDGPGVGYVNHP